jgi:indolepyruvate ferredoxin oxidoreductase
VAEHPSNIHQVRIEQARADVLIGCDLVVSSSPQASRVYDADHTRAVLNTAEMATGDFVRNRDANLRPGERIAAIRSAVASLRTFDANRLSSELMGDTIYANVLLLGAAYQAGLLPVTLNALERAIELNGVKVAENLRALAFGRIACAMPGRLPKFEAADTDESLDEIIGRRAGFLADYQDERLAGRYRAFVGRVRAADEAAQGDGALTRAVAQAYFRLLAYKDEYEVARLHAHSGFVDRLRREYGPGARIRFHLAPPVLNGKRDSRGRPLKKSFGAWMLPVFRVLAALRRLRGGPFDVFGYTRERRMERALIHEFEETIDALLPCVGKAPVADAVAVVTPWLDIRGYGPVKDTAVRTARPLVAARLRDVRRCADEQG